MLKQQFHLSKIQIILTFPNSHKKKEKKRKTQTQSPDLLSGPYQLTGQSCRALKCKICFCAIIYPDQFCESQEATQDARTLAPKGVLTSSDIIYQPPHTSIHQKHTTENKSGRREEGDHPLNVPPRKCQTPSLPAR